jgi:AGCS family alanine or glycine:cation symporter
MISTLLTALESLRDDLWSYIGFPAILSLGILLTIQSGGVQIFRFPKVLKTFFQMLKSRKNSSQGVHPLGAFFTSLGGCVGIGNVVAICGAVKIGGPGALFWVWVAAFLGMVIKYSEVYLGMKFRIRSSNEAYEGGPMYFLQQIFTSMFIPNLFAILICIYGVEIYQFAIVANSIADNFQINYLAATLILLALILFTVSGGIHRVAQVSTMAIPLFIILYLGMGLWIIFQNITAVPQAISLIFNSAFSGQAAIGGFAGSTAIMAISQGIAQGCYSTDVGIGYSSIIHSKSRTQVCERQASLTFFEIFIDTFVICTLSIFIIILGETWKDPINESLMVQHALAKYFPYMHFFMPIFLFLLGYSTVISFFYVGLQCAQFLSPRYGKKLFYLYAILALFIFSFIETRQALMIMSFVGVLLLTINLYGIFKMRHEVSYNLDHITADEG